MSDELIPILEDEFEGILQNRPFPSYFPDSRIISFREFNYPVRLKDQIHLNRGYTLCPIYFRKCVFKGVVDIGDAEKAGSLSFDSCIFENKVSSEVENTKYTNTCEFKSDLNLFIRSDPNPIIDNMNVSKTLQIFGKTSRLTIKNINANAQIKEQIILLSLKVTKLVLKNTVSKDLQITNSEILDEGGIIENIKANLLFIEDLDLESFLYIQKSDIAHVYLGDISGSHRNVSITEKCNIGHLHLPLNQVERGEISISQIENIELVGANSKECILNIEQIQLNQLSFEQVYNYGLITLRELKIEKGGKLLLRSSNLGKTDFINCDFARAILEFENSKITDAFFSDTKFPIRVELDGKNNPTQGQLAFGQLAMALQKQGDSVRALEYQSREIDAHFRNIHWLSKDFFNKLNLGLNFISNNFNRSWVLGIIFSIGFGLIFFSLLLLSTDQYRWGFPTGRWDLLPIFLKFMNPLRFIDIDSMFNENKKLSPIELGTWSYIWDFVGRIFIVYGYYQTIQAFRRFGRK